MILKANNLIKTYSGKSVVKDVSLNLKQGEIVGLLGPNGAGKTTSFYMIVGLIKPNSGSIFLDDKEITRFPMYKRAQNGIGYLAQESSVFRKMSVEDNIHSVLEMTNLSKEEQQNKVESLLDEFGLKAIRKSRGDLLSGGERRRTEIARALATNPRFILLDEFGLKAIRKSRGDLLSGGERRRTEIARALATNPSFILLDEPFAGVDPLAVEDIQKIVRDLTKRNIGILITDHNVQETLAITDRTYLMFEGSILKDGKPEELANDELVRKVYLGQNFELRKKTI